MSNQNHRSHSELYCKEKCKLQQLEMVTNMDFDSRGLSGKLDITMRLKLLRPHYYLSYRYDLTGVLTS